MKGFIEVTRNLGGFTFHLLVHYTQVYKENGLWKHNGKNIEQDDEEIKQLIINSQ